MTKEEAWAGMDKNLIETGQKCKECGSECTISWDFEQNANVCSFCGAVSPCEEMIDTIKWVCGRCGDERKLPETAGEPDNTPPYCSDPKGHYWIQDTFNY